MRIRFFSVLWVSSSILCVGLCVAFTISYARAVHVKFIYHNRRWEVGVEKGQVIVDDLPQVALEQKHSQESYLALAAKSHDLRTKIESLEINAFPGHSSRDELEQQQAEQRHEDAVELFLQARGDLPISGVFDPDAKKKALHDLDLKALAPVKDNPTPANEQAIKDLQTLMSELFTNERAMAAIPAPAAVQSHSIFALRLLPPLLVLPLFRCRSHQIRKIRMRGGLCLNCGYNLQATPNRCPECGTLRG